MSPREQSCTRADAVGRLRDAQRMMDVADLIADDETIPGVAAALAVLAGIAASDAACCVALGVRPRGQNHRDAVGALRTVVPGGPAMAKDLQRLLGRKDDAHYGFGAIPAGEERKMVAWAHRLIAAATIVLER